MTAKTTTMAKTMAADEDDSDVDGNGATGNEVSVRLCVCV
jgi:hypothetical protein